MFNLMYKLFYSYMLTLHKNMLINARRDETKIEEDVFMSHDDSSRRTLSRLLACEWWNIHFSQPDNYIDNDQSLLPKLTATLSLCRID